MAHDRKQALLRSKAGVSFALAGQLPEAIREFDLAAQLVPTMPDPQINAARATRELGLLDEAEARLQAILAKWPENGRARIELAYLCSLRGDLRGEIFNYRLGLKSHPEDGKAHWNLGLALLSDGQLAAGFTEFEWRFRCPEYAAYAFESETIPKWQGESLAGKRLLVVTEQGLGDAIQFIRYAILLQQQGATITLRCWPKMQRLLSSCDAVTATIPNDLPLSATNSHGEPNFDFWISMLSLPHRLGTTRDNVPAYDAYLRSDPALANYWRKQFREQSDLLAKSEDFSLRVGLAWQGSPSNPRDAERSLTLATLEPLFSLPQIQWVCLQKDVSPAEEAYLRERSILNLGPELDNDGHAFWDTAAVLDSLDLVIGCDSAVAHLSGALGVPTWLALARFPDWRWQRSGERTAWYPKTRLYRQSLPGEWQDVVRDMSDDLRRIADGGRELSLRRNQESNGRN